MSIVQWIGAALVAAPIVGIVGAIWWLGGWRCVAFVFGSTALVMACLVAGVALLHS